MAQDVLSATKRILRYINLHLQGLRSRQLQYLPRLFLDKFLKTLRHQ